VNNVSVVGLPDAKYGEVVAAFVIKHEGKEISAKEVRDYVREHLSGHLGEWFRGPDFLLT
jgi:acyl-CoA synthetase (AMP-forming)/AMP-acid ligase II